MAKDYGYKGGNFLDNSKINLAIRRSNLKQNNEVHGFIQGWERRNDDGDQRGAENCKIHLPWRNISGRYISFLSIYEQIIPYDEDESGVIALTHRPKIYDVWNQIDGYDPVSLTFSESLLATQSSLVEFNKSDGSGTWKKRYLFVETKLDLSSSGLSSLPRYLTIEFHPWWNDGSGSYAAGNADIYGLSSVYPTSDWNFSGCLVSTYKNAAEGSLLYAYDELPAATLNALMQDLRVSDNPPHLELITALFATEYRENQVSTNTLFDEKVLITQDYDSSTLNVGFMYRPAGQGADKGLVFSYTTPADNKRQYVNIEETNEINPTNSRFGVHEGAGMVTGSSGLIKPRLKQGYVGQQGETGWFDPGPHPDYIAFLNCKYENYISQQLADYALIDRSTGDPLNPRILRLIFEVLADSMYAYRPMGLTVGDGGICSETSLVPEHALSRNPSSVFFVKYNQGALTMSFAPVDYLNG